MTENKGNGEVFTVISERCDFMNVIVTGEKGCASYGFSDCLRHTLHVSLKGQNQTTTKPAAVIRK